MKHEDIIEEIVEEFEKDFQITHRYSNDPAGWLRTKLAQTQQQERERILEWAKEQRDKINTYAYNQALDNLIKFIKEE